MLACVPDKSKHARNPSDSSKSVYTWHSSTFDYLVYPLLSSSDAIAQLLAVPRRPSSTCLPLPKELFISSILPALRSDELARCASVSREMLHVVSIEMARRNDDEQPIANNRHQAIRDADQPSRRKKRKVKEGLSLFVAPLADSIIESLSRFRIANSRRCRSCFHSILPSDKRCYSLQMHGLHICDQCAHSRNIGPMKAERARTHYGLDRKVTLGLCYFLRNGRRIYAENDVRERSLEVYSGLPPALDADRQDIQFDYLHRVLGLVPTDFLVGDFAQFVSEHSVAASLDKWSPVSQALTEGSVDARAFYVLVSEILVDLIRCNPALTFFKLQTKLKDSASAIFIDDLRDETARFPDMIAMLERDFTSPAAVDAWKDIWDTTRRRLVRSGMDSVDVDRLRHGGDGFCRFAVQLYRDYRAAYGSSYPYWTPKLISNAAGKAVKQFGPTCDQAQEVEQFEDDGELPDVTMEAGDVSALGNDDDTPEADDMYIAIVPGDSTDQLDTCACNNSASSIQISDICDYPINQASGNHDFVAESS